MQKALREVEQKADSAGCVKLRDISNPALKELAKEVKFARGSDVPVKDLKAALKAIGAQVRTADRDANGKVDGVAENKWMSPLATRLLALASDEPAKPTNTVSTGCTPAPRPAPRPRPVNPGC
jgi:hypothetical protein